MTDDNDLEQYFKAARSADPRVPEGLTARVLADAETVAAGRSVPHARTPQKAGFGALASLLGGWRGLAGLGAAAAAGLVIGFVQPEAVTGLAGDGLDELAAPGTFGLGFETGTGLDLLLQEEG